MSSLINFMKMTIIFVGFFSPLAALCVLWDLISPTRDRTQALSSECVEL